MRTRMLIAGAMVLALMSGSAAQEQGQRGRGQGQGQNQARRSGEPPTLEAMQQAVARLEAGRIARPKSYDTMTPDQQNYVKGILTGPRGAISGPLSVMMVSPNMGNLLQQSLAYSRFAGQEGFSSVIPKYNELGIIMVARHWTAQYIWNAHARYAVTVGVPQEVVDSIRAGKRPTRMEPDIETIYNFVDEMLTRRKSSDANFQATKKLLGGDKGVVDLVGTLGLYQISSMMVVVDELVPANQQSALPPLN